MTELDSAFDSWLNNCAEEWGWPVDLTATQIGRTEIANRLSLYPEIEDQLRADNSEWPVIFDRLRKCWALGGRFAAIRFNEFIANEDSAADAVRKLLDNVERDEIKAIDRFVETAIELAYVTPTDSPDRSGAALLASVILTCYMPKRFVDYRKSRWKYLATELNQDTPGSKDSIGTWVAWAGEFASDIIRTKTYQQQWGSNENLWTIAGICWDAQSSTPPPPEPPDPAETSAFAEGGEKYRMHLIRERNRSLVEAAKQTRRKVDPSLLCEVCGFSYVEAYGPRGEGFIEAHHKIPISQLTSTTKTKIQDLALLCANCHRMAHREPLLSVEQLRESLLI